MAARSCHQASGVCNEDGRHAWVHRPLCAVWAFKMALTTQNIHLWISSAYVHVQVKCNRVYSRSKAPTSAPSSVCMEARTDAWRSEACCSVCFWHVPHAHQLHNVSPRACQSSWHIILMRAAAYELQRATEGQAVVGAKNRYKPAVRFIPILHDPSS